MYAVIEDSGKQFKVEKNSEILVDVRDIEPGSTIVFPRVVAVGENGDVLTDPERLGSFKVAGTVLRLEKGPKVVVRTFKRRKKLRRKKGYRAKYLRVKITEISEKE